MQAVFVVGIRGAEDPAYEASEEEGRDKSSRDLEEQAILEHARRGSQTDRLGPREAVERHGASESRGPR